MKRSTTVPLLLLTPLVLLVHGFHPLADDGAVYVTGIKKLADPALFQMDAVFALSPTRVSIFAHVLAALRVPLPGLLLFCQLASIFLFLLGSWKVAARLFLTNRSRWGAVLLAACCFTLPVAGTSLCIMDPYVTARSFSTPLSLFAMAALLDEAWAACAMWLVLAALLHPLMAAYATITVLAVAVAQRRLWRPLGFFVGCGWLLPAAIFLLSSHGGHASAFDLAVLSRSYFFLSSWRGYEYFGLLLPLLLGGFASRQPGPAGKVALAMVVVCSTALMVSLCFVHRSGSLLVARLQVLRSFQFLYLAGVLLAGGWLATLARKYPRGLAALYCSIALAMFAGQRLTYPASNHVEWPGMPPGNHWQQAFLWIRANTPQDAVFALENDYVERPGEDAQGFRAIAERSAVADYFKDGGIASNFPQAALPWRLGSEATAGLNLASDPERSRRLQPFGVGWIVLPAAAATAFLCPYTNARVRVCRLSPLLHDSEGAK